MPIKKISDLSLVCRHPEHDPPRYFALEPGIYEHTCPKCGAAQRFAVDRPTLTTGGRR